MKMRAAYVLPVVLCLTTVRALAESTDPQQADPAVKPATTQDSQTTADAPPKRATKRETVIRPAIHGYYEFIRDVYADHEDYLKKVRENPDDKKVPADGASLAAVIGISLRDFITVQAYALQVYPRAENNDAEFHKKLDEMRHHTGSEPELTAFSKRHEELMQTLISDLQKEMDKDAFQRVDHYVLHHYRMAILAPAPAGHRQLQQY